MKKLFVLLISFALSGCFHDILEGAFCGDREGRKIELCDEVTNLTVVFDEDIIGAYSKKRPACLKIDDGLGFATLDDRLDNNYDYSKLPNSDFPIEMNGVWNVDKIAYMSSVGRFWMILTQGDARVAVSPYSIFSITGKPYPKLAFEDSDELREYFCGKSSK